MTVSYEDVVHWLTLFHSVVAENKEYLTELDSAIGDADHGANMDRGMRAAMTKVDGLAGDDIGNLLKTVGMTLVSTVGGAGGPLYGTLFLQMGLAAKGKSKLALADWASLVEAGVKGVQARGKAEVGDKTMVDALVPARDALQQALSEGVALGEAVQGSADAAEGGMKATIPLVARKGRASYLGERSAGHQDPGATSSYLMLRCAADAFADRKRERGEGGR